MFKIFKTIITSANGFVNVFPISWKLLPPSQVPSKFQVTFISSQHNFRFMLSKFWIYFIIKAEHTFFRFFPANVPYTWLDQGFWYSEPISFIFSFIFSTIASDSTPEKCPTWCYKVPLSYKGYCYVKLCWILACLVFFYYKQSQNPMKLCFVAQSSVHFSAQTQLCSKKYLCGFSDS